MSMYHILLQITATAADSASQAEKDSFRNLLIASEIIITAIVFTGFFFIFRNYKRREAKYIKDNKKQS